MYMHGLILKNIRKSKGYSLKNASDGILSVSLLSKFERGESEITISKFFLLLERFNVSIDEYSFILNEYKLSGFKKFISDIRQAYINNNVNFLLKLEREELEEWESTKIDMYKFNAIMIRALASDLDDNIKIIDPDIQLLTNYLFETENWNFYEIILFGNSMSILPINLVILLTKEALKKTYLYREVRSNKEELIRVILNSILLCLQKKEINSAALFISSTEKLLSETHFYFEITKLKFLKGIYYLLINKESGLEMCLDAISVMKLTGDKNLAHNHEEYLKENFNFHI